MTSFTITCNGVDISAYIEMSSLIGQNDLTQRIDTLQFTTYNAPPTLISDKADVIVTDETGTRWFGGIVGTATPRSESRDTLMDVQVQGYAALLDTALANKVYSNTADDVMIQDLVNTYRPGEFTVSASGGGVIDHISFPYKTLSSCIDNICAIEGAKYYVDPNKVIHFFFVPGLQPVRVFTDQNPDGVNSYSYEKWQMERDSTQVQNRVTVIGQNFLNPNRTDTFTGNGNGLSFELAYRPNQVVSITVAGAPVNFGHLGVDNYGGDLAITVLVDNQGQIIQFQSPPAAGQSIVVTYNYYTPIIGRAQLTDPNTGQPTYGRWYDGKVVDGTITSIATAIARATTVLGQYGYAQRTVKFTTRAPWTRSGQAVLLTNTVDNIINQQFLIQSSRWYPVGSGVVTQDMQLIG